MTDVVNMCVRMQRLEAEQLIPLLTGGESCMGEIMPPSIKRLMSQSSSPLSKVMWVDYASQYQTIDVSVI